MRNFNKFALRLLRSARLQACWLESPAVASHPLRRRRARNEPSFLSQRKDEQMQRKVRDREDALASTPGGVRSPEYHRTSTSIGRIGIELHPSATNGSRGEQPVYQLHGEV